jgi:hypothetical protein
MWHPTIGQNNLDKIAEKLEKSRVYDHYIVALCPFHNDRRPSFFVYEDTYRCLSCGAWGETETLLSKLSGITVNQPSDFRNPWSRWLRKQSLKEIIISAWKNGPSIYIRERGIPDNVQKKLGIGLKENWITFPIIYNRKIVGAVARKGSNNNSSAKYIVPYGQDANLLYIPSEKLLRASESVYLTFGLMDSASLYLRGLGSLSTVSGKRLDPTSLDFLRKPIYIIPDHGEEKEAHELASKLGWRGHVLNLDYPLGTKDCNDLLQTGQLEII